LFKLIKEKRVQEIILNPLPGNTLVSENYSMLNSRVELNMENIKKVKLIMGIKQYLDGQANLVDKNMFRFNSNTNDGLNL
jgi:hypothetical protein